VNFTTSCKTICCSWGWTKLSLEKCWANWNC